MEKLSIYSKPLLTEKVNTLKEALENKKEEKGIYGDLTRPGEPLGLGTRHPISIVKNQIIDIFSRIGFNVSEGPEIEDDWHNFTALNLPEYHPARGYAGYVFYTNRSGYFIAYTYLICTGTLYGKTTNPL